MLGQVRSDKAEFPLGCGWTLVGVSVFFIFLSWIR